MKIKSKVCKLIGVEKCILFFKNELTNSYESSNQEAIVNIEILNPIITKLKQTRHCEIIPDTQQDKRYDRKIDQTFKIKTRNCIFIPYFTNDGLMTFIM